MLHESKKLPFFYLSLRHYFSATVFSSALFLLCRKNYFELFRACRHTKREICKIVAIARANTIERNNNRNQRFNALNRVRVSFYFVVVKCAWTVFITCNECWWSFRTLRFVLFCLLFFRWWHTNCCWNCRLSTRLVSFRLKSNLNKTKTLTNTSIDFSDVNAIGSMDVFASRFVRLV